MTNIAAAHEHKFDERVKRKVSLSKYEFIEGMKTSEAAGFDYILLWKCKCNAVQAYDLERHSNG